MTELPHGWSSLPLGVIGRWFGGGTPSKANPAYWVGGTIPWLSPKDMGDTTLSGTIDHITETALDGSPVRCVPQNSVAMVVRSGILERKFPVATVPFSATLNQDMKAVVPFDEIEPKWVMYFLRSFESEVLKGCRKSGTTVASIETSRLMSLSIPIPPLAEQRRIVAALEDHLSRLDAGAATLRSGKLRAARLKVDVVDGLFRHIEGSNTELLGSLIREPLRNGYSGPTSSDGIRAITLTAVTKRSFIDEHTKNIKIVNRNVDDLWLQSGDIFVQRSNTPDLVGTSALYDGPSGWAIFPDLLIRVRVNQRVNPEYMNLCLSSSTIRDKLKQAAKGLAGSMPKIDQPTLEGLAVPTPSLEDQQRIVAEAASTQGACSRLASQLDVAEQRSGQLRRSLLAEAFAGHLVPQDPDDEPASVLLERVKAERTAAPKPKRTRKTTTTQGSAK